MFLLSLGLRNLSRQWGRNAFSLVSIVAGVAVIILGRGFITGMKENVIRAQIDTLSGHVLALPTDYPTRAMEHPVDGLLRLSADDATWLDAHATWTTRVLFVPTVVSGVDAMRVRAIAYDPERDASVFPRDSWQLEGEIPTRDGVLASTGIAEVLGLKLGDSLVLKARTTGGALNALALPIKGLVKTGNPMMDRGGIFLPAEQAKALIDPMEEGMPASHLVLRLPQRARAPEVASALSAQLGRRARVSTWEMEVKDIVQIQDLRQKMMDFLALALLLIAATGIANTVLMGAYERVREIGTLRALGLTPRGVLGLFLIEGFFLGLLGSGLGTLLGGAMVWRFSQVGLDMTAITAKNEAVNNLPFSAILYLDFSWITLGGAFAVGVLISVLASLYPAHLASQLLPADAVRAE